MKVYFPYENVRDEQKKLMKDICETIEKAKVLLANAPTGLGKTASSICPALSYAIESKKKVFFLTPKSSQHEIALETVNLMNQKFNLGIKAVDLVGKRKMCVHPLAAHVRTGFYEACSGLRKKDKCNFYINARGKTPKQRIEARKRRQGIRVFGKDYYEVKKSCFAMEMCPYEVTLDAIKNADLIIGDYFHVFNDDIRKTIFENSKIRLEDCILIIDEAHNLPKRIRDMLSTTLKLEDLESAEKEAREIKDNQLAKHILEMGEELMHIAGKIPLDKNEVLLEENSTQQLRELAAKNIEALEEGAGMFMSKKKKEGSFLLNSAFFLGRFLAAKKHTLRVAEMKRNSPRISLYPLDPSEATQSVFAKAHSSVLMSGTLLPLEMYCDILGIAGAEKREYASPFPKENRLNVFVGKTTTKYSERNDAQFGEIAAIIASVTNATPGNSIVFFPSFEVLRNVSPRINIARKVLEQRQEMRQEDKSRLVKEFKALGSGFGGVLLAVSGGSIAEGIDFPGENLKCAIVVGIPFEKVSIQSKALIDFYDKKFGKGWDYAYNAPAISRAVQAAGRVIRTETDRGACVFLDRRFLDRSYERFFPREFERVVSDEPEKLVRELFK